MSSRFRLTLATTSLLSVASLLLVPAARAQFDNPDYHPAVKVTPADQGAHITFGDEVLDLTVCGPATLHVVSHQATSTATHQQPWLLPTAESCPGAKFSLEQDAKTATLKTAEISAIFHFDNGHIDFRDPQGNMLVHEADAVPRTYEPVTVNGEKTLHVVERFNPNFNEGIYGLGQHQNGLFNYRGATVELGQNNTDIAIPMLISTAGYGILWNSAAFTYVDNRFPLALNIDSAAGDGIDYFLLAGPEPDQIIHHYRNLTGHAPLLPRWAYGYVQSRDRYASLDEIQTIASLYRSEHIPIDAIVQDWFWWKTEGDPVFNSNYHDVPGDLAKLHDAHIHTMISTWGMIDPKSETWKKLDSEHLLIARAHVYDASVPRARDLFWSSLIAPLQKMGWDSFWLDSAEPEEYWPHYGDAILRDRNLAIGNGSQYTNVFPLLHNQGIQDHWKQTEPDKRVFLLTRSAFLGQQRVGGTVWSGDVFSSFWGLKHQIAAGLNYSISGLPYWTTDIGGYWPTADPWQGNPDLSKGEYPSLGYQELYLRWFQFGVFCPVFRSHGHRPANEIYTYTAVKPQLIAFDKLRYRLLPYIYSTAWQVTSNDDTLMRPLVMDFRQDPATFDIADQYLFGRSILVNPVTEAGANHRQVYLPKGEDWFDFWTGDKLSGGQTITAPAPLDKLPLYVRAGSILPLGPVAEYADQSADGPYEIRIYPGHDAHFTLYLDSGDGYEYQQGQHLEVPLTWHDATRTLTIGYIDGGFAGQPRSGEFHIVLVHSDHGSGPAVTATADQTVTYTGNELNLKF